MVRVLYHEKTRSTGYIPPEAFIHLDKEGYIQNRNNLPLIYHVNRKNYNKKIEYNVDLEQDDENLRFMYKLSDVDISDNHRKNKKNTGGCD